MSRVIPKDKEYFFDENIIISQTDTKGIITYVNKMFCKVSGYDKEDLLGKAHNIIQHPDMPKAVFKKMWETIQNGQSWNGLIKNLRKDGLYYWVDIEILPIKSDDGEVTGYIAANKAASIKDIQENEEIYKKMLKA